MNAKRIDQNVQSAVKPSAIQITDYEVYVRSNLRQQSTTSMDGAPADTIYVYTETTYDKNEYLAYLAQGASVEDLIDRSTLSDSELVTHLKNLFNRSCDAILSKGIELDTTYGKKEFSCKLEDQINLTTLHSGIQADTTAVDYHGNGDKCRAYPIDEFAQIIAGVTAMVYQQTAYCNLLKSFVETADRDTNLSINYGYVPSVDFTTELNSIIKRGLDTMKVTLSSDNKTYNAVIDAMIKQFEESL